MGSRGLSRAGLNSDGTINVSKYLGKKTTNRHTTVKELTSLVNPNFKQEWLSNPKQYKDDPEFRKWAYNCAKCSTAGVLQILGYDVEALGRNKQWFGFDSVFNFNWDNYDNYVAPSSKDVNFIGTDYNRSIDNPNKSGKSTGDMVKSVENAMNKWGTRSVAIMNVTWKSNDHGHAVVVYNTGKHGTLILDFQNHHAYRPESFLKRVTPGKMGLYRLDNAELLKNSKDINKVIKRRKKK